MNFTRPAPALRVLAPLLLVPTILCACNEDTATTWTEVWSDEFDGPAGQLPSAANWTFDIGTDWGNAQLEYDTDRPENVSLDGNGNLAITARRESYMGSAYTSGRIKTQGLFDHAYGASRPASSCPSGRGSGPPSGCWAVPGGVAGYHSSVAVPSVAFWMGLDDTPSVIPQAVLYCTRLRAQQDAEVRAPRRFRPRGSCVSRRSTPSGPRRS